MPTYARIRRLTQQRGEDIDKTFRRLADLLRDSGRTATLRCTILLPDGRRQWTFDLAGDECRLRGGAPKKSDEPEPPPDLEIITAEGTWWEIADGRLSPLDAFGQGRLRVLGDTELGSHLLRNISDGGGAASICGG